MNDKIQTAMEELSKTNDELHKVYDDIKTMTSDIEARATKWNTWPYRILSAVGTVATGVVIALAAVGGISFITVVVMLTAGTV